MSTTAALLASLETIHHHTTLMLAALDGADVRRPEALREAKLRVLEIRRKAQELFDALSEDRLENPVM